SEVLEHCKRLREELKAVQWDGRPLEVILDDRDLRGGEKNWQWVKKGVPLRIEVGPRDIASDSVFVARRDTGEKKGLARAEFVQTVGSLLDEMQRNLFERAKAFSEAHTRKIDSKEDFYAFFTPENADKPEIHGGFALTHCD